MIDNKSDALSSSRRRIGLYCKNAHYRKIKYQSTIFSLIGTLNVKDYKQESPLKGIALLIDKLGCKSKTENAAII